MQVLNGMVPLASPVLRLLALGVGIVLVTTCMTLLFRPALTGWGGEKAVRQALARLRLPALHDVVPADALGHTQVEPGADRAGDHRHRDQDVCQLDYRRAVGVPP